MLGLGTVVLLVLVVVSFVRGLEASLVISGDPLVALVHSLGAAENIENASVNMASAIAFGAGSTSAAARLRRVPRGRFAYHP